MVRQGQRRMFGGGTLRVVVGLWRDPLLPPQLNDDGRINSVLHNLNYDHPKNFLHYSHFLNLKVRVGTPSWITAEADPPTVEMLPSP